MGYHFQVFSQRIPKYLVYYTLEDREGEGSEEFKLFRTKPYRQNKTDIVKGSKYWFQILCKVCGTQPLPNKGCYYCVSLLTYWVPEFLINLLYDRHGLLDLCPSTASLISYTNGREQLRNGRTEVILPTWFS